ncbi:MAG: hypothetical protein JXI43_05935 [Tissierellales bacterium]|nr:hypothetical protein [Tissierellales bacterium]
MDKLEKAYYESKFENAFLKAKGNAFQSLLNDLMGRAYKSDYMPCRPLGNHGERLETVVEDLRQRFVAAENLEGTKNELDIDRNRLLKRLRIEFNEQKDRLSDAILAYEETSKICTKSQEACT